MARFHHSEIADLGRQLVFSPAAVRLEQVNRAERLACLVEPGRTYPYEFVCYQITGYRPRGKAIGNLPGKSLREDLVCLVEQLSATLEIRVSEVGEPVLLIAESA